MAAPAKDAAGMDLATYEVTWKDTQIGLVDDVDPTKLSLVEVEQKIGELANVTIDKRVIGLSGTLGSKLSDVRLERMRQLMPWAAGTGTIIGTPSTVGYSKYANSGELRFHPKGAGDATQDLVFPKAFPNMKLPAMGGDKFRAIDCEWDVFPDQAALIAGTLTYYYIGEPPE